MTGETGGDGVHAWLGDAPQDVRETTERLLDEVARMRESQVIYPAQDDILNALAYTSPADVRVVILGQDPYHEPGQAMGLAFSVPAGERLPPSLRNVYKELSADLGCPMPASGDLTPWARQGALLLNTSLTVREHAASSHAKLGWRTLTDYVVRRCFELPQPVVFLAWGRHAVDLVEDARAQAMAQAAPQARRLAGVPAGATDRGAGDLPQVADKFCLASTHPSPLSANRASGDLPAFMGSRPFSRANRLLREHGSREVDWASVG